MITIKMKNGTEFKYNGKILLAIDDKYPHILMVTSCYTTKKDLNGWIWNSQTWDNIFLEDIESIKGERDAML